MGVGLKVLARPDGDRRSGQLADSRVMPYLSACAARIAGRGWDITKYALGAVNEYAGGTNTEHRAKMHEVVATLRAQLPNTLLLCASAGWNAPDVLTDGTFVPPPDDRILVEWHGYDDNGRDISAAQHGSTGLSLGHPEQPGHDRQRMGSERPGSGSPTPPLPGDDRRRGARHGPAAAHILGHHRRQRVPLQPGQRLQRRAEV